MISIYSNAHHWREGQARAHMDRNVKNCCLSCGYLLESQKKSEIRAAILIKKRPVFTRRFFLLM